MLRRNVRLHWNKKKPDRRRNNFLLPWKFSSWKKFPKIHRWDPKIVSIKVDFFGKNSKTCFFFFFGFKSSFNVTVDVVVVIVVVAVDVDFVDANAGGCAEEFSGPENRLFVEIEISGDEKVRTAESSKPVVCRRRWSTSASDIFLVIRTTCRVPKFDLFGKPCVGKTVSESSLPMP